MDGLLSKVPMVSPPYVPANTKHSYWLYFLRVKDPRGGALTQRFGEALIAEGVPAWVRYIVDPLYCSPLFTKPATYGISGYPFSEWGTQTFESGLCPNAERALDEVIAIHWNENLNGSHVHQIAAAISAVASRYSRAANSI